MSWSGQQHVQVAWAVHASTRISSMSLVTEGPEIRVRGRTGSSRANASARSATIRLARTTTRWKSGTRIRAAALAGAVVQDYRVGLGDRDRAARDDPGLSGRVRPPGAAGCRRPVRLPGAAWRAIWAAARPARRTAAPTPATSTVPCSSSSNGWPPTTSCPTRWKRLQPPRVTHKLIPVFTRQELTRLEKAYAGRTFTQRRGTAIIAVFKATGIRLATRAQPRICPRSLESRVSE